MNIDIILILSYLFITLLIGCYFGRSIKTVSEYALGGKKYSTIVLVMTFLATTFGAGSTVGDIAKVADEGIIFILVMSGFWFFCIIMITHISKYFDNRFHNMISIGDIMRHFYGSRVERIVAILGGIFGITAIGGQLIALGHIFSVLLSIDYKVVVTISSIVLVIYTTFGGIKAVVATDYLQCIIVIIVMPITAWILLDLAGGWNHLLINIDPNKLRVLDHPRKWEYLALFICGCLPFLWLYPSIIQRFLMTNTIDEINQMYKYQLYVRILFSVVVAFLAFSAICILPNVPSKELMPQIIAKILPETIRGLFIIAILAATMSAADSHLNACAVLLTHNFLLRTRENHSMKLIITKIVSILIGILAIFIALYDIDIINLMIISFSLWGAVAIVPMLAAVMKLPYSELGFWVGFMSSVITYLFCQFIFNLGGFIPCMLSLLASILGFSFSVMIIQNKEPVSR